MHASDVVDRAVFAHVCPGPYLSGSDEPTSLCAYMCICENLYEPVSMCLGRASWGNVCTCCVFTPVSKYVCTYV